MNYFESFCHVLENSPARIFYCDRRDFADEFGGEIPSFQDTEGTRERQIFRMSQRFWTWRPSGFGAFRGKAVGV